MDHRAEFYFLKSPFFQNRFQGKSCVLFGFEDYKPGLVSQCMQSNLTVIIDAVTFHVFFFFLILGSSGKGLGSCVALGLMKQHGSPCEQGRFGQLAQSA